MKRLKTPELHVPPFLLDLFDDLRDRRLLPLIALIVVAIAAAPFLLSDSGGGDETASWPAATSSTGSEADSQGNSVLAVAKAAPGLRDYRKRLKNLPEKNPFRAPGSSNASASSAGQGAGSATAPTTYTSTTTSSPVTSTSSTSAPTSTSTTDTPASTPTEGPTSTKPSPGSSGSHHGGNDSSPPRGHGSLLYFTYRADVRIVHNGKTRNRKNVPLLSQLPNKKDAAVMFMGVTGGGKKALLLVSDNVVSVFGDAKCALGSEHCDLLAVEPGFPETFVFPGKHKSYRINVLRIRRIFSKKPPHLHGGPRRQQLSSMRLALPAGRYRFSK